MEELEKTHTKKWTKEDQDNLLKELKTNKTRDPHGWINELFKPVVLGEDLKMAMLSLFNAIKKEQKFSKFMQFANITTIYKNKCSRQEMNNDRGIFVVSTMRKILDK